ncbi:5'/3'-nucleotidase SurE [Amorphus orientalis]|uniref:5'-nucleotidase SurE n=1 Tax=Amorphus orientalis TaxID=649198 RepID=A0AAE4AUZ7_9HYPH|nr:5'/3'-nucleotidase SurE [Amorphus orientalis]MDQ0316229.1 5'-nucleotidase [Amorphus orientalis]
MRILVTNDDGIHAPGLWALEEIAKALTDDVWVVAPETDQSGSSHSLTINDPLRLREVGERHFAVRGTPTDCVIMGMRQVLDSPPDLVLSGINRGHNLADDLTYSGTVAGAMEGTILGVRSIALSQAFDHAMGIEPPYETAVAHAPELVRQLLAADLPSDVLININFPAVTKDKVAGVKVTLQGRRDQAMLGVDERRDGRGNPYYWIAFERRPFEPGDGTDLRAVREGYISVTPLRLDLTAHRVLDDLKTALGSKD